MKYKIEVYSGIFFDKGIDIIYNGDARSIPMMIDILMLYSALSGTGDFVEKQKANVHALFSRINGYEYRFVDAKGFGKSATKLIFISSGGTERAFKQICDTQRGPFFLITTDRENSLAAAMEMLAYLQEQGQKGEIIHGSEAYCATRLYQIIKASEVLSQMAKARFGIIGGEPDLLCSTLDAAKLKQVFGTESSEIGKDEFFEEIKKKQYEANEHTQDLKSKGFDASEVEKALYIYGALKRIIKKYHLTGVAVKCFHLLDAFHTTGCLALAILNAEGIHAACEADSRTLLSMFIIGELSENSVFMANPSSIDAEKNEMVIAHCVVPLNMPRRYQLMTHFESGLGVAVKGELKEGSYTLFKCWEDGRYHVQPAVLLDNLNSMHLCRTQARLAVPDAKQYLTSPLANHQVLCKGDQVELVKTLFGLLE